MSESSLMGLFYLFSESGSPSNPELTDVASSGNHLSLPRSQKSQRTVTDVQQFVWTLRTHAPVLMFTRQFMWTLRIHTPVRMIT